MALSRVIVADFSDRLTNRNDSQGDGRNTGVEFRRKFLSKLDNADIWKSGSLPTYVFDFEGVMKISPSFANEVFTHFTQFADIEKIRSVFRFESINVVHQAIIDEEIRAGYDD